ncbi:MAG: sensor histidine kinase [Ilyomonas sp.]
MKNDYNTSAEKISNPSVSAEEHLKLMADYAPVMMWIAGLNKGYNYLNNGWQNFTGKTIEEGIGDGWSKLIHPDDVQKTLSAYKAHFDKQEPFKIQYRFHRHDGEYRWILNNGVPHYDEQGNFTGYIGSCIDISEIKELEERRNNFISAVSHEIKTPLTAMKVYIQILEDVLKSKNEPQVSELVSQISKQANRFTLLVKNLLDISKTEEDTSTYKKAEMHLDEVVKEVVEDCKKVSPDAVFKITGHTDAKVFADKDRIAAALKNLLNNAYKYAEPKEIIINLSRENGNAKVSVTNPGSVISAEFSKKVFEKYYRIPDRKNKTFPGIGIGLYITSQIIQNHDGDVWVDSDEAKGTIFSFTLPIIK